VWWGDVRAVFPEVNRVSLLAHLIDGIELAPIAYHPADIDLTYINIPLCQSIKREWTCTPGCSAANCA
jgi:hypothetical protein